MKKIVIFMAILMLGIIPLTGNNTDIQSDKIAIKKAIREFIDDCMNNYKEEAAKKHFHPDYRGLSLENNALKIATTSTFIEYAKSMKTKESQDSKIKRSVKILDVDVVEKIGLARFEVYAGEKLHGTDFIVFLKTGGEWQFIRGLSILENKVKDIDPCQEKTAIKKVIARSLVDAAGNYWDIEKWKEGFHPGFTGLTFLRNVYEKDTFSDWEEAITTMNIMEPEGHRQLIIGKVPNVHVLGHIGIAEVKIYYGVALNETAYILFLKFEDGWKIVSKVGLNHRKGASPEEEKEAVMKVIQDAYVDGIQNLGKIESIERGFHPDFALLYINNNKLEKLLLPEWIESVKMQKKENPGGPKEKTTIKYLMVDVLENMATAKFEVYRASKLIFTDVMTLLKFNEGWKIVSKVSHRH
ncbi:MAG: nuclear transport factor 2 family protein [Candidatus Aminicenantes bacterium]|nr:nuclear transport factor 2 family protein [Candidatus Aminicenantes bacterium]